MQAYNPKTNTLYLYTTPPLINELLSNIYMSQRYNCCNPDRQVIGANMQNGYGWIQVDDGQVWWVEGPYRKTSPTEIYMEAFTKKVSKPLVVYSRYINLTCDGQQVHERDHTIFPPISIKNITRVLKLHKRTSVLVDTNCCLYKWHLDTGVCEEFPNPFSPVLTIEVINRRLSAIFKENGQFGYRHINKNYLDPVFHHVECRILGNNTVKRSTQ